VSIKLIRMDQALEILKSYLMPIWEMLKSLLDSLLLYWDIYMGWLPHSRLVLLGLVLLVILLGLVGLMLLKRRGSKPGKLRTGRDLRKEARWYEKNKEFVRAGELYERIEKYHKAIEMYLAGRSPDRAARVYMERFQDFDKALSVLLENNLYEQAGSLCAQVGDFNRAGEFYEKARKLNSAAEMYEKGKSFGKAAELYEQSGFIEESANCYGLAENFEKAASLYERVWRDALQHLGSDGSQKFKQKFDNLTKRAAFFYKKAGDLKKSAEILEQSGMTRYAVEMYVQAKEFAKAGEGYLKLGDDLKAAEMFDEAGDKQRSAEIRAHYYQKQGQLREAVRYFELAGDYLTAADLYASLGDKKKAGELYLKGGDSRIAAETFYASGEKQKAAEAYETAGNLEMAIGVYQELGDEVKLSELYEKAGRYYEAALAYQKRGLLERALGQLTRIVESDPHYQDALKLAGDILFELGKYAQAFNYYRALAQKKPFDPSNLDLYYRMARIYEQTGQLNYAQSLYQRIYSIDPHFQEVTLRMQELGKRLSSGGMSPGAGATMLGTPTTATGAFRYQVVRELGRGGMGVVYLAKDLNVGRMVAYKVLPEDMKNHPEIVANFIRESESLKELQHPYIVQILDRGQYQGNYFIVMEYVEGEDLKTLAKMSRRVPLRIGIEIFKQLAQALDYAHSKKIVHRDIKPSNIMWTPHQMIKIMDFGLAKLLEEVKTGRTLVSGTPLYMSPEQTLGKPLDHRTDIYSAGVTMYELFCGQPPFTEGDIGYHHIHTPPRAPKELNPEIPDELNKIILKCLAKAPEQRYQNAREIYLELKALER